MESFKAYYRLCKPGIVRMVMITGAFGYLLGGGGVHSWGQFLLSILGIGLGAAGSAVLNNFLERDVDAQMDRTMGRELPRGRIKPENALGFGIVLTLLGTGLLLFFVNELSAFLVLLAAFLYVVVYTPLKRRTWLNTSIGAIPGALPMTCGWVAATNHMDAGAFLLFALLYAWQHPHFYAIAWIYKDDYAKADFKMLSVVDESGARLFTQVILYSFFMLAISVVPTLVGLTGRIYLIGACLLGFYMVYESMVFVKLHTIESARKCLRASIIYLPAMLLVVAADLAI